MEGKKVLVLLMLAPILLAGCSGDKSAPSPKAIILHYNTLIIKDLMDPCKVKVLEIIYSRGNQTHTLVSARPMVNTVKEVAVTLPSPPLNLTVLYADMANNTGTISWSITAYPYTTHYLEKMVSSGGAAVVQILMPPNKPLLPREFSDPSVQSGILTVLSIVAFVIGLVRWYLGKD